MTTQRKTILDATGKAPPGGDYVWDGKDETERPLTREEMQKGVETYRKRRSRPAVPPNPSFERDGSEAGSQLNSNARRPS
jgi:hypothetical protein